MESVLFKLKQLGINLDLQGDQLKLEIPEHIDAEELIEEVKRNKLELISCIKKIKHVQGFQLIKPCFEKEYYVLSSTQKRLYFLHELHPSSLLFNMPQVFKLDGRLDRKKLEIAFLKLINRHESLRTSFLLVDGEPVQKILDICDFSIEVFSVSEAEVSVTIEQFIKPFDLSNGPLIRVGLLVRKDAYPSEEQILLIDIHHIVTDGESNRILINELISLYNDQTLQELHLQYKDFAEWQQSDAKQDEITRQKDFWLNMFAEPGTLLELPYDFKRPPIKTNKTALVEFCLSDKEYRQIKAISETEEVTLFMVILSFYNILLSKISNQEDIVVGVPIAGRQHPDLDNIVGMFVNTLAVRNFPKTYTTYRKFLQDLKVVTLSCFDNQSYPYEVLVDNLNTVRELNRNPLFDVFFIYQQISLSDSAVQSDFAISSLNTGHQVSHFDLTLAAIESEKNLKFILEYSTELFNEATILRFKTYFLKIVTAVLGNLDVVIGEIKVLSKEEEDLINAVNSTATNYPYQKTIVDLFEEQVIRSPQNIALRLGEKNISYQELHITAQKFASYLVHEHHVAEGDLVGILLDRDEFLIPAIYGTLMAGAAYVPIDRNYPLQRINSIVEDSGLKLIISRKKYFKGPVNTVIIDLDSEFQLIELSEIRKVDLNISGQSLAYVIYTSGSTGVPKGVMIEHHSVINRLLWMQKNYSLNSSDIILQKTSIAFDVSVWELFWWSFTGASLCLLAPGAEKDPLLITETIRKSKVSTIHFVPSMLQAFLTVLEDNANYEDILSLKWVFCSGEALKPEHVNLFASTIYNRNKSKLINLYGPTEATVDVSYYECKPTENYETIPIGKPIDNTRLYILNKTNKWQPFGVPGELHISGTGLARGYLNREGLTKEKFINLGKEKAYKTGDLAKWAADGSIVFLGRIDSQVKIRGYRIELAEVENTLLKNSAVKEAVVLAYDRAADDKALVAFVVVSDRSVGTLALKKYLKDFLPEYMIPSLIIPSEAIPFTPNGKVDTKQLLLKVIPNNSNIVDYDEPATIIEKQVADLWGELLKIDRVGLNDTFFDLGGNSLLLIKNNQKVKKLFNVELPYTLYFHQTLQQIAREISRRVQEEFPEESY